MKKGKKQDDILRKTISAAEKIFEKDTYKFFWNMNGKLELYFKGDINNVGPLVFVPAKVFKVLISELTGEEIEFHFTPANSDFWK